MFDLPQLAAMFSSWIHKAKTVSYYQFARNKELADCLVEGFCPTLDKTPSVKEAEKAARYNGTLQIKAQD